MGLTQDASVDHSRFVYQSCHAVHTFYAWMAVFLLSALAGLYTLVSNLSSHRRSGLGRFS